MSEQSTESSQFDYVLQMLANRCRQVRREKADGIVFLLGAGCSRQYGLPNFSELLTYIWDECFVEPAASLGSFQALRDQLEKYWQAQGPEARRTILERHLGQKETVCPGYQRLAVLAKEGYVKAIVNMNFDNLLEAELEKIFSKNKSNRGKGFKGRVEVEEFKISTSFRVKDESGGKCLMVYKPHGSLRLMRAKIEFDHLVGRASDAARMINDSKHLDEWLLKKMRKHLKAMKEDLCWTPPEIVTVAEDLLSAVRKPEIENGDIDKWLDKIENAQRRAEQVRRNPLWAKNDLILDIANSDLFSDPGEQIQAQELFTNYDVVSIGYSGVDAKVAAALRSFSPGKDSRDRKLYFVNLVSPDPRILLVMADRVSQDLCITGEDAAFENFMEHLQLKLDEEGSTSQRVEGQRFPVRRMNLMTRAERVALAECLRLAQTLRAAINVGDRGSRSVREHGDAVFEHAVRLSEIAGVSLTSPEKYLLYCAAYLHDLGYFSAYSLGGSVGGLQLLQTHGKMTATLLRQWLRDDPDLMRRIMPASYDEKSYSELFNRIVDLCHYHTSYLVPDSHSTKDLEVNVRNVRVNVRFMLLHALFAAAEHIAKEHPFLPSSGPVTVKEDVTWAVEDPILALYLRRKEYEVSYALHQKKVEARFVPRDSSDPTSASPQAIWFLRMASGFVANLNRVLHRYDLKSTVAFVCDYDTKNVKGSKGDGKTFRNALEAALADELNQRIGEVQKASRLELIDLLLEAQEELEALSELNFEDPDLMDSLALIASQGKVWICALTKFIRERWIESMGEDLRLIRRRFETFTDRRRGATEDFLEFREAIESSYQHFQKNLEPVSFSAAINTLDLIRRMACNWLRHDKSIPAEIQARLNMVVKLLSSFQLGVSECSTGEALATLDLLAIYSLPMQRGEADDKHELRVGLNSRPVSRAIRRLHKAGDSTKQELLYTYFQRKKIGGSPDILTEEFFLSFDGIIHPAWRFFARHWRDRSEALLMARACLDLGSSRYRPELVGGLRHLLSKKVEWNGDIAYAHDQCTICTSRLLYVLSQSKRLFSQSELDKFTPLDEGRSLDETVFGVLRFFLSRKADDDAWWGLGTESRPDEGVHAADYLAWAARAVAFCRSVDWEIEKRTGRAWLKSAKDLETNKLSQLLLERWENLFGVSKKDLIAARSEEPHTFTLGRVALSYLDLFRLENKGDIELIMGIMDGGKAASQSFLGAMRAAFEALWRDELSQMSRFHLIPVRLVLDSAAQDAAERVENARALAKLCSECVHSRIWIRKGSDTGSWGFNVKNTQAIVSSLAAFWRYALAQSNVERFKVAFDSLRVPS